jgi:hypothetical protein
MPELVLSKVIGGVFFMGRREYLILATLQEPGIGKYSSSYYRYRLPNTDGILPSEYRDFEIPWYPVTDLKAATVKPYRLYPVYLPVTGTPWLLFTE